MQKAAAKIIACSTAGETVCASAARISTTDGTALEIFERAKTKDNNGTLIEKVVASGHTSVLEHSFFTVAFDSVSVFAEEFVIEFRLGSYTVKSRRYVDYTNAGFYVPALPDQSVQERFTKHMQSLFSDYAALLELGVPKEDARFVLPYCFRSHFYCTMNARELLHMVHVMTQGRGSLYPELKMLGESLLEQLRAYFPNVPEILRARAVPENDRYALPAALPAVQEPHAETAQVLLHGCFPAESELQTVFQASASNWMTVSGNLPDPEAVICGERPRELELIHAHFEIRNLSLAAITHLVRHRVQTVLVPHVTQAVLQNAYIIPESVSGNPEALRCYQDAFRRNTAVLREMLQNGLPEDTVQYFALAGNQLHVTCAMNGRELLHFIKLRTCSRAQWEIRACAVSLLRELRKTAPSVFRYFGPSCFVTGKCPEGRLSCGKQAEMKEIFGS